MKAIITYLNFDGNCREAMTFYGKCLEAELTVNTFADAPEGFPKERKDRVMHARLTKGPAVLLMASDTMPGVPFHLGSNFSVSIGCESLEEIEKLFTAFGQKGKVTVPLQDMFWGARFGMVTDQFGISWMFNFEHPKQG